MLMIWNIGLPRLLGKLPLGTYWLSKSSVKDTEPPPQPSWTASGRILMQARPLVSCHKSGVLSAQQPINLKPSNALRTGISQSCKRCQNSVPGGPSIFQLQAVHLKSRPYRCTPCSPLPRASRGGHVAL
jgi:hypothetical protein